VALDLGNFVNVSCNIVAIVKYGGWLFWWVIQGTWNGRVYIVRCYQVSLLSSELLFCLSWIFVYRSMT